MTKNLLRTLLILSVLFLAYTIATADTTTVTVFAPPPVNQPDPAQWQPEPAAAIVATAVPALQMVVIPNPPNPQEVLALTPVAPAAAPVLPVEAVFTLTTGEWVNDVNAQFLTDCAYNIAKGLVHDPACPVDAAALLGVGR